MIEKVKNLFQKRDKDAEALIQLSSDLGLNYISETIDNENYTKTLHFEYRGVGMEISIRKTTSRYPVMVTGLLGESLLKDIPEGMSKTVDGIRIGAKGKGYPKTLEHAIDQVLFFKMELDRRLDNKSNKLES